jgi:ribosomal protein L13
MSTYTATPKDIEHRWFIVDADGMVLGRLATEIVRILRGKGMPVLRGGGLSGDLYVEVAVETPVKLSKKQKELLRTFETGCEPGCQPESEGFLAKLKEIWTGSADA